MRKWFFTAFTIVILLACGCTVKNQYVSDSQTGGSLFSNSTECFKVLKYAETLKGASGSLAQGLVTIEEEITLTETPASTELTKSEEKKTSLGTNAASELGVQTVSEDIIIGFDEITEELSEAQPSDEARSDDLNEGEPFIIP